VFTDAGAIVAIGDDGSGKVVVRQQTKPEPDTNGVTLPGFAYHGPTFMPDGRIALIERTASTDSPSDPGHPSGEGPGLLHAVQPDGSGYQAILGLELNRLDVASAVWSPDGGRILLAAREGERPTQIWRVNTDGTGLTQLTTSGTNIAPAWSPTGAEVAFASSRDGHFEIYRMSADGSDQRRLTTTVAALTNCGPTWGVVPFAKLAAASPSPAAGEQPPTPFHRGRLQPGTYLDALFQPPFAFTVADGWIGFRNYIDGLSLTRQDKPLSSLDMGKIQAVLKTSCLDSESVPLGAAPRDVIDWLRANKYLKTSVLRPVNVGGYSGLSIAADVVAVPDCRMGPNRLWLFFGGSDNYWLRKGDHAEFTVIDVRGTVVTIIAGGASAEGFAALAGPVVRSLDFDP
jgi:hypothetical protein